MARETSKVISDPMSSPSDQKPNQCSLPYEERHLFLAAQGGWLDWLDDILNAGIDVNCVDHHGWTPLMVAAYEGEVAFIEALLSRGADIHARSKSGETALHRASAHPLAVEVLLRNGAKVDEGDDDGQTPLIRASIGWEIESVKLLLDAGAAVNATDKQGRTPLMYAACCGEAAIVRLLLERGGDPNIRATSGELALDLAKQFDPAQQPKQCNYEEVVRLLENWKTLRVN